MHSLASVRLATLALLCGLAVHAQTADKVEFDAASVKPFDLSQPRPTYQFGPSRFTNYATLDRFILQAYDLEEYQVAGGPDWAKSEFYLIEATAGKQSTRPEIRRMLQSLLAERFQLKLHRETRTMSGYVLTVDKKGPKLPPPKTDVPPENPGVIQIGGGEVWVRGGTMKRLATGLHLELAVPVVDETGIEGRYDVLLRFDERNQELEDPAQKGKDAPGIGSVFTALHEFGLRLEPRKLPIEVLVIDSAERPAEN